MTARKEKEPIMVISDHPLSPRGGHTNKYFIEAMLKTGKYRFICLAGAIKASRITPSNQGDPQPWMIFLYIFSN